jgi:CHAD domain-containing protein
VARAREVPGLRCDDPFVEAAERVIAIRSEEVLEFSRLVRESGDLESVHDARVATRRLRAAMEIFEPCFPRKPYRNALKRVKRLADALGERRDRDVAIGLLEECRFEVAEADSASLAELIARLQAERNTADENLAPLVAPKRLRKLRRRLDRLTPAERPAAKA